MNDRFVAKKFVVVAEVPVAFAKVKFWRVVEPSALSVPDGKIKLPPVPKVPAVIVDADCVPV